MKAVYHFSLKRENSSEEQNTAFEPFIKNILRNALKLLIIKIAIEYQIYIPEDAK